MIEECAHKEITHLTDARDNGHLGARSSSPVSDHRPPSWSLPTHPCDRPDPLPTSHNQRRPFCANLTVTLFLALLAQLLATRPRSRAIALVVIISSFVDIISERRVHLVFALLVLQPIGVFFTFQVPGPRASSVATNTHEQLAPLDRHGRGTASCGIRRLARRHPTSPPCSTPPHSFYGIAQGRRVRPSRIRSASSSCAVTRGRSSSRCMRPRAHALSRAYLAHELLYI